MNRAFKYIVVSVSTILVTLILGGSLVGQNRIAGSESGTPYRHLSVYAEVLGKIKSDYVEEPDMKNVTLGAINGLLISIDPFASYLSADQYKQYSKAKELHRAGVGLVLSRKYPRHAAGLCGSAAGGRPGNDRGPDGAPAAEAGSDDH
jgi:carboxyl-terminal processing protease